MKADIVMYHYVRPIKGSKYPNIKGLEISLFEEQLEYLRRYYSVVTMQDIAAAIYDGAELPANAALLTFDDGYTDHYKYVLPLLEKHKFKGCFFPPLCAVRDRKVLSVNKIHFILNCAHPTELAAYINKRVDSAGRADVKTSAEYLVTLDLSSRFDLPEVIYIKLLLQCELPEDFREQLVQELFGKYVSQDEKAFAEELYISESQLKEMRSLGHHIGSHGSRHYWLSRLRVEEQRTDIDDTVEFLQGLGEKLLTFCYPYGVYNDETVKILEERNFKIGLTTEVGAANLTGNPLTLARWDTNDFPKDRNAEFKKLAA